MCIQAGRRIQWIWMILILSVANCQSLPQNNTQVDAPFDIPKTCAVGGVSAQLLSTQVREIAMSRARAALARQVRSQIQLLLQRRVIDTGEDQVRVQRTISQLTLSHLETRKIWRSQSEWHALVCLTNQSVVEMGTELNLDQQSTKSLLSEFGEH